MIRYWIENSKINKNLCFYNLICEVKYILSKIVEFIHKAFVVTLVHYKKLKLIKQHTYNIRVGARRKNKGRIFYGLIFFSSDKNYVYNTAKQTKV